MILEVRFTHLTIRDENILKTQTLPSLRPTQRYLPSSVFSVLAFLKSKKVVVDGDIRKEIQTPKRNMDILIVTYVLARLHG